jgi:hypothetical protein
MTYRGPFGITSEPKIHTIFPNSLPEPAFCQIGNRTFDHSNVVRYFHRKLLNHASPQQNRGFAAVSFSNRNHPA